MVDTKPDTQPSALMSPRAPGLAALVDALTEAAFEDLAVAVVTRDNDQTRDFLREFRTLIPEGLPHTARLTSGNQCLTFPEGGAVHFYTTRQSLRGHSLDRVYATEFDAEYKYLPNICGRQGGKVVIY